ncbi:MAG: hypothetical protein E7641_03705 [Ruminococcaceae bacterium]|nr:hypothetical protein [Oscillospiraceae bacterium]
MPGPGGGARGGGGFGGGSRGGGFGGGFGGGPRGGGFGGRPPYHRPPMHGGWGWGWGPRFGGYYGGGGCLGGLMGMLLAPIILVFLSIALIITSFGSAFADITSGGSSYYDEITFQDYANEQYSAEFGSSTAYEDNLLIVFLVDEESDFYTYIAWVGDDIATDINTMFGANDTKFGNYMKTHINQSSYKYSLSSNLAAVMEKMTDEIVALDLESNFKCDENHNQVKSHLTNKSNLEMNPTTVDTALQKFTEQTGIPAVIVVDDIPDVFEKRLNESTIITIVFAVILLVIAIVLFIKIGKNKKKADASKGGNGGNGGNGGDGGRYNNSYGNSYNRDYH